MKHNFDLDINFPPWWSIFYICSTSQPQGNISDLYTSCILHESAQTLQRTVSIILHGLRTKMNIYIISRKEKSLCLLYTSITLHVMGKKWQWTITTILNSVFLTPFRNRFPKSTGLLLLPSCPSSNKYRIYPRIGRTPNFPWFPWEKKNSEVEYQD